jgi:hypothetical protein
MQPGQGFDERTMRSTARRLGVRLARPGRARYALGRLGPRPLARSRRLSDENRICTAQSCSRATARSTFPDGRLRSEVTRGCRYAPSRCSRSPITARPTRACRGAVDPPATSCRSRSAHNALRHPRDGPLRHSTPVPGPAVYRTDDSGRIVLESDGFRLSGRSSSTVERVSERPSQACVPDLGSDRPKVETAVQRLRARFVPESVECIGARSERSRRGPLCNFRQPVGTRVSSSTDVDGRRRSEPSGDRGWKLPTPRPSRPTWRRPRLTVASPRRARGQEDAPIARACAKAATC